MTLKNVCGSALALCKAKFFGIKIPLFVGWALTARCNLSCRYCSIRKISGRELEKHVILRMINELSNLGTRFISFTGGEPLLRDDIYEIIDCCKKKFINVSVNSNGWVLKEKFDAIKNADLIILSLDGPKAVHDHIRGEGSYDRVMEAAETIRAHGIRLNFAVSLSNLNLEHIVFLTTQAKKFSATVTFQPVASHMLYGNEENLLAPPEERYKQAIKEIISLKKGTGKVTITSSITALNHLYHWPHDRKIKCASGFISCRIKSDGDMCLCNRNDKACFNTQKIGLKEAFCALPDIMCAKCWCAQRVELNLLYNLKYEVISNNLFCKDIL